MGRYDNLITNQSANLPGDWKKQTASRLPHSGRRSGQDVDNDGMNKSERRYAEQLELRRMVGEVRAWWFQEQKFRMADRTWYTPDFFVQHADGTFECVEIKGHLEDDAAVKFKVCRERFPCFRWTMLHADRGGEFAPMLESRRGK